MSFETACFSMSSDISMRMRLSLSSKSCSAKVLAIAVFPTPVGPANRKQLIGRDWSCKPVLARNNAAVSVSMFCRVPRYVFLILWAVGVVFAVVPL